jgi:hypothetical protein
MSSNGFDSRAQAGISFSVIALTLMSRSPMISLFNVVKLNFRDFLRDCMKQIIATK